MKKQSWLDEYTQMVDDCEARESKLSDWEVMFLESIENRLAIGNSLTPKQIETLENIWEKVTKNG